MGEWVGGWVVREDDRQWYDWFLLGAEVRFSLLLILSKSVLIASCYY